MKIIARITTPSTKTIVLGDTNGEPAMDNFTEDGDDGIDEVKLFRAPFITLIERNNAKNSFSFTVWRIHSSLPEAYKFSFDHRADLRALCDVEFKFDTGGASMSRFLRPAKVNARRLGKIGVSTQWQYTIIGGEILKA